jgi:hypothetical protein
LQLNLHHRIEYGSGNEFVPVYAPVHNETSRNDYRVITGLGQQLGLQRDFQATGDLEQFNVRPGEACDCTLIDKRVVSLRYDLAVPAGLNESDLATPG